MSTTRKIGLLVLLGVGIGAAISYFLPNLNFSGPGSGKGRNGVETASNSAPAAKPIEGPEGPPESSSTVETGEPAAPAEVVYVMIEDREYQMRLGAEGKAAFKPTALKEVVTAAQAATGDSNGIRIRIAQRSSARETTERALREALEEAGIPGDAIRWKDEPVE